MMLMQATWGEASGFETMRSFETLANAPQISVMLFRPGMAHSGDEKISPLSRELGEALNVWCCRPVPSVSVHPTSEPSSRVYSDMQRKI